MAGFKHDSQGFLIGEIVETNRELARLQQQGVAVWKTIRTDVKAIARAVGAQVAATNRTSQPGAAPRPSASSSSRTLGGNYTGSRAPSVVTPAGRASGAQRSQSGARTSMPAVVTQQRSTNGRFVAGQKASASASGSSGGSGDGGSGAMRRLSDSIGRLSASMSVADNIDPTLNAAKEIKDVITPLGRGLFGLFGASSERKKERWYSRILKALKPGTQKAQAGGGGADGGGLMGSIFGRMFGGLGGILKAVPGLLMTVFTRILGPIALLWGAFELGQWVGRKINEWLDASGLMPHVFDAFDAIGNTFSNAWESVTKGIDAVVDGITGAWKGITDGFTKALDSFMEFPKKMGEFFAGLDESMRNIPVIGKAYAKAADALKGTADEAKTGYAEGKSGNTAVPAETAAQAAGRDVGKTVGAVQAVGTQAHAGYSAARDGLTSAPAPASAVQNAARAVGGAAGTAANWALGETSKRYESGKGGAGTVSSGKGDYGGASYGTYQLSSNAGTLAKFLQQSPYGEQFAGLKPGSPEFNAKWKEIAKNDPSFGTAQHDFIKSTHYDPMAGGLKKDGIDIDGRGAAVKDAVWSTSVQFGGESKLIQRALKGQDTSKMSDAQMIASIQDYKASNNDSLFSKSSAATRASTLARAGNEKASLLKLDGANVSAVPATPSMPKLAAVSLPSASPTTIPAAPELRDPPPPLNSGAGAGRGVAQVNIAETTGQNVRDRGIAHIVTGGLGAA